MFLSLSVLTEVGKVFRPFAYLLVLSSGGEPHLGAHLGEDVLRHFVSTLALVWSRDGSTG